MSGDGTTRLEIPDVPESIHRDILLAAVGLLGLDPNRTKHLSCDGKEIIAEVYARAEGSKAHVLIGDGESVATHMVRIKIVEPYMVDKP
jgi:hypothetical protein